MRKRLLASAVVLLTLSAGCSHAARDSDERGWFTAYISRATADLTKLGIHLTPSRAPRIGTCTHHQADVTWEATVPTTALRGYPSRANAVYEVGQKISDSMLVSAGLDSEEVHIITGGEGATDTLVLKPSKSSRVQVSIPLAEGVLAVGYVSC